MPVLEINLAKIRQNTANIKKALKGIELVGVIKACQGDIQIAEAMVEGGADFIAEARIENFSKLRSLPVKKMLLRTPLEGEDKNLLLGIDYVMVSALEDIRRLRAWTVSRETVHGLIVNIETGFSREGFEEQELTEAVNLIKKQKNLRLVGFSTNTACGAPPKSCTKAGQNGTNLLNQLNSFTNVIQPFINDSRLTSHASLVVSGGNSSILPWAVKGKIPKCINQLRIGEGILLGHDTVNYKQIASNFTDAFKVQVQLTHIIQRKGRKQAILAIGVQDIGAGKLQPLQKEVESTAAIYSDYLTVNLKPEASFCDWFWFKPDYYALLALMTSPYVRKKYITGLRGRF